MELLFATGNAGKLRDVRNFLQGTGVVVVSPSDLVERGERDAIPDEVEETGATYDENALLKAQSLYEWSGIPTIGDDSGLEVQALDGAPALFSARYAGQGCSFDDNIQKLLQALSGEDNRAAKFVSVVCYFAGGEKPPHYFRGELPGVITEKKRGAAGFGYDPVFEVHGRGQTLAELKSGSAPFETHRTKALQEFVSYLESSCSVVEPRRER